MIDPSVQACCSECGQYVGDSSTAGEHQKPGSRERCPGSGQPTR
ncbi:hypothetical protein ACFQXA_37780 [Nocardiopsis composta]